MHNIHDSRYFIDLLSLKSELLFRDYSPKTQEYYIKVVEEFLEATNKEIEDIGILEIERYLDKNREKLSINTVVVMLDALRFFFREILGLDIADEVNKYKREYKFREIMTVDQMDLLIGAVPIREKLLFQLIRVTGMKTIEVKNLRIDDINKEKKSWTIGNYSIPKELAKDLIEYAENQEDEYIFLSQQKKPLDISMIRLLFKEHSKTYLGQAYALSDMKYGVALEMWRKGNVDKVVEYLQHKDKYQVKRLYKNIGYELSYYSE